MGNDVRGFDIVDPFDHVRSFLYLDLLLKEGLPDHPSGLVEALYAAEVLTGLYPVYYARARYAPGSDGARPVCNHIFFAKEIARRQGDKLKLTVHLLLR